MKLHSPQFEKALKKGVKRRIKVSPELKREFRAANKFKKHYSGRFLVRPLISLGLAFGVWKVFDATRHPASGLAVASMWTALSLLVLVGGLRTKLFASTDMAALIALPINEGIIFRWQLQKFLYSAAWQIGDLLAAFGVLALALDFSYAGWCGVLVVSALTWLFMISLAALWVALGRGIWSKAMAMVTLPIGPAAIGLLILGRTYGWSLVLSFIDRSAHTINLVLPPGWAISLFQLLAPNPQWMIGALLVPVGAVLYALPHSLYRLRKLYVFREVTHAEAADLVPSNEDSGKEAKVEPAHQPFSNVRRVGPTAITDIIRQRRFLASPAWPNSGRFEKLLWQWFTPRERVLSDFMFPAGLSILTHWKLTLRVLGIAIAFGFVIVFANPTVKAWSFVAGIFVTLVINIGWFYQSGRGFQPIPCSGVRIPLYTNFAVGLHEISRVTFKLAALQSPALLLWSAVCGMLIANMNDLTPLDGIMYGLRGGVLLVSTRFIAMVFSFSSGTNDTTISGVRQAAFLLCMVVLGIGFLLLGGIGLFVPRLGPAWLLTALAMLDAYCFFRIYAWFYHRNIFDLMSPPRR